MTLPFAVQSACLFAALGLGACAHNPLAGDHPADRWAMDYESSALWKVTNSTPISYVILPQTLSVRTPQHARTVVAGHDLTLQARFSLLAEPIARGPESVYLGIAAGPVVEYWFAGQKACVYTSAGGGFGAIDSTDVVGGQGQDFTLNWYAAGGLRYYVKPGLAVNGGVFFQHLSNGGATDPNPGLNAVGPAVGLSWSF